MGVGHAHELICTCGTQVWKHFERRGKGGRAAYINTFFSRIDF